MTQIGSGAVKKVLKKVKKQHLKSNKITYKY